MDIYKRIETLNKRMELMRETLTALHKLYKGLNLEDIDKKDNVFLSLFQRINSNLKTSIFLLNDICETKQGNSKIPLAILVRNSLSDSLLGIYFNTLKSDFNQELIVLGHDFVDFLSKTTEKEVEYMAYFYGQKHNVQELFDDKYDLFVNHLATKKGELWKLRKRNCLRGNGNGEAITPSYIFNYLREISIHDDQLYYLSFMGSLYRYFSQYEHYTFANAYISRQPLEKDFCRFEVAFELICRSVIVMSKSLSLDCHHIINFWEDIFAPIPPTHRS